MKSNRQLAKHAICIVCIILSTSISSWSDELLWIHPLYTYRQYVKICILPFQNAYSDSPQMVDIRHRISQLLLANEEFRYQLTLPSVKGSPEIFDNGFSRIDSHNLTKICPVKSYWENKEYDCLLFGTYKSDGEKLQVEVFLYEVPGMVRIFGKVYRLVARDLEELDNRIATEITRSLGGRRSASED